MRQNDKKTEQTPQHNRNQGANSFFHKTHETLGQALKAVNKCTSLCFRGVTFSLTSINVMARVSSSIAQSLGNTAINRWNNSASTNKVITGSFGSLWFKPRP